MTDLVLYADAHLFPPAQSDFDRVEAAGLRLVPVDGHLPKDFAPFAATAAAIMAWGGPYGREVFDSVPLIRVVARCGAGFDNIDRREARARGILVSYVPGASDDEVAEHTMALLLDMARKVTASDRAVRAGQWQSSAQLAPMTRIKGRTLGLIGFGRIARAVTWRAQGIGILVNALDPYQPDDEFTSAGVRRAQDLPSLLAASDFVSLHIPAAGDRQPILGESEFRLMRQGAVLINTARGSLIDTAALVTALRQRTLAGAALDVLDAEPVPVGHPLLSFDNVVLTPHSAAFSEQALSTLRHEAISNVLAVLRGEPPITPVPDED